MVPPRRLWQFRGICRAEGSVERVEGSERASSALWERRLCARATGSYRDHQREFWGVFLGESEESERVLPRSRSEVSREFSQVERSEQLGPTAFTEEVSRGKSRAIAVLKANTPHAGLGRSPRQTRQRKSARPSRPRCVRRRTTAGLIPCLECGHRSSGSDKSFERVSPQRSAPPNTHGSGADVRARAKH